MVSGSGYAVILNFSDPANRYLQVGKKGCCWNICPDSLTFWLPLCHYDGQQLLDAEVTKTVMVNIYKLFKFLYFFTGITVLPLERRFTTPPTLTLLLGLWDFFSDTFFT